MLALFLGIVSCTSPLLYVHSTARTRSMLLTVATACVHRVCFALQEALRKYSVVPVVTRNLNTVSRVAHWWLIGSCRHCVGAIGSYQCPHTNEDVAAAHAVEAATLAHPLIDFDSPRAAPAPVLVQDDELLGHRIPKGSWIIVHVQVGGTGAARWLCVGGTGAAWCGAFMQ